MVGTVVAAKAASRAAARRSSDRCTGAIRPPGGMVGYFPLADGANPPAPQGVDRPARTRVDPRKGVVGQSDEWAGEGGANGVVADGKTEHGDRTLEEVRQEVVAAADDLERMTAELRPRTRLVERLEALADTLLDLIAVPVVVVDTEGRIVAV